jgi:hypothetical protein
MQAMAEAHVAAFDERTNGWGSGTKSAILKLKEGVPPTACGTKDSSGNGVIIKLAPLCFWYALKGTPASQVSIEVRTFTFQRMRICFSRLPHLISAHSRLNARILRSRLSPASRTTIPTVWSSLCCTRGPSSVPLSMAAMCDFRFYAKKI